MIHKIDRAALAATVRELQGISSEDKDALLELINDQKKYGLVWENKPEDVEERLREEIPVLREVTDRAIISDGLEAPNHILIEGDNLDALTALSYTHEGKIDVIYIDPPYNTGNKDFIYNDSFVDAEDSYRHSKWLSFMNKRLKIAKRLLSDKGVIFISIDDNEQAQLKLLCDEIFGYDNFAGDVSWQRTYSPRNDSKGVSIEKEHVVVYSRQSSWIPNTLPRTAEMDSKYKNPDNDIAPWTSSDAFAPSAATHQGMVYAIQHPFTGKLIYPYKGACWPLLQDSMLKEMNKWVPYQYKFLNDDQERADVCGILVEEIRKDVPAIVLAIPLDEAKKKVQAIYEKGPWPKFYFTNKGKGGIRRKTYLNNVGGKIVTNLWLYSEVGHTDEAKKEITSIFNGTKPFDTPKPSRLIKRTIQIASDKKSIILDFFAGSGTTLHATMQLNAEDGGHRQCILVTNNENNICEEVTYERNKRVINGYTNPKGEKVEGLHNNNLRYYQIDFIDREQTEENKQKLMKASTALICIKEDVYAEKDNFFGLKLPKQAIRYFEEKDRRVLVIYNPEVIPYLIKKIVNNIVVSNPIQIYVLGEGQYPYTSDFEAVLDKVELHAMPHSLYQAYRQVLPAKKAAQEYKDLPEMNEKELNEIEENIYKSEDYD